MVFYAKVAPTFDVLTSTSHVINKEKATPYIFQTSLFWSPPLIAVRLLVRRAKLGFVSQGQVLTPEVLARYRVPRVASLKVTTTAKRTQGGDGPQCVSVKGLSPVMNS